MDFGKTIKNTRRRSRYCNLLCVSSEMIESLFKLMNRLFTLCSTFSKSLCRDSVTIENFERSARIVSTLSTYWSRSTITTSLPLSRIDPTKQKLSGNVRLPDANRTFPLYLLVVLLDDVYSKIH